MTIIGSRASTTIINTIDKAEYMLYINQHSHTYIRQVIVHTRLISQCSSHNCCLQTFLFQGKDIYHTVVLGLKAF